MRDSEVRREYPAKREQYKRLFSFGSSVLLVGILTALFGYIWYHSYYPYLALPFYRRGNWAVIAVYAALIYLFFRVYGGFKVGYLRRTDVIFSQLIGIAGTNLLTYFQISLIGRDFVRVLPMFLLTIQDMAVIVVWTLLVQKIYFKLYPPRRLIVVYGSPSAAALVIKMSERVDKYMICASVSADEPLETICQKMLSYDGVIIHDIPSTVRSELLKFCFDKRLRAYVVPKISDIILRGAQDIRLFDTPLLLCRNYGLTFEQRFGKRLFDLCFSIAGIVVGSPVMLLCAAAVKLCDGGPVLYRQKRLTEGGREFYLCKFRSMVINAEKDGARLSGDDDTRVTKVGKVLRRWRLDELPQLFNILKGEMSVVGPRPERPELCAQYEKEFPEFRFRLHVKAGLTGYAQVTGAYDTTPYDKLRMDLMYIENYSMLRDIQIVLMTLKTMIFPAKNNAEILPPEIAEEETVAESKKEDDS